MAFTFPFPSRTRVTIPRDPALAKTVQDNAEGLMTKPWQDWLVGLTTTVQATPERIQTVSLSAQAASIAATPVPLASVTEGLYRVAYYARITQAATTSSSLTVTLAWPDTSVTCSFSGAAMTGNTTSTTQSGTVLVFSDDAGPITYATTYASVGATPMQYRVSITVERVDA